MFVESLSDCARRRSSIHDGAPITRTQTAQDSSLSSPPRAVDVDVPVFKWRRSFVARLLSRFAACQLIHQFPRVCIPHPLQPRQLTSTVRAVSRRHRRCPGRPSACHSLAQGGRGHRGSPFNFPPGDIAAFLLECSVVGVPRVTLCGVTSSWENFFGRQIFEEEKQHTAQSFLLTR